MDKMKFTEEDKDKLIEFLNLVAKHGTFNLDTSNIIKYFKALAYIQQTVIPKVDSHIFEVKRVVETENKETKK